MKFAIASDTYLKRKLNVSAKQLDEKLKEVTFWFIENNADNKYQDKLKSLLKSDSLEYTFQYANGRTSTIRRYTVLQIFILLDEKPSHKNGYMPEFFTWTEDLEKIKKLLNNNEVIDND